MKEHVHECKYCPTEDAHPEGFCICKHCHCRLHLSPARQDRVRSGSTQRMLESVVKSGAMRILVVAETFEFGSQLRKRVQEMVECRVLNSRCLLLKDGRTILFINNDLGAVRRARLGINDTRVFYDPAIRR